MASIYGTNLESQVTNTQCRQERASRLSTYEDFITKNVGQVSQIESALRSLTYVIPGRFRDAEIASEAIHSGVQLLSLYHDLILMRVSLPKEISPNKSSIKGPGPMHAPSKHTRYTSFWTQRSPIYRRAAIALQVVRHTELLCEMIAKRRGERLRWRVVVLVEAAKAICRLLLFRSTRCRILMSPTLPMRQTLPDDPGDGEERVDDNGEGDQPGSQDVDTWTKTHTHFKEGLGGKSAEPQNRSGLLGVTKAIGVTSVPPESQLTALPPLPPLSPPPSPVPSATHYPVISASLHSPAIPTASSHTAPPSPPPTEQQETLPTHGWSMPRTGMSLPPLPQPGDITPYLLSRVLTADDIKPATKLLNQQRGSGQVAEILHILAPLVYALALAHSFNRIHSSKRPILHNTVASWAPWLVGLAMEMATHQLRDHNSLRTTTLEREEWGRRGWEMGWWSMRSAFYEHVMKGVVVGVRSRMPKFVGGILEDYEYLWGNYYFSTST